MNFNLDIAIFIGFLTITLILGISSSRGIKSIKEYAIGDRNFSTATISATLVATWIGGEDFFALLKDFIEENRSSRCNIKRGERSV